MGIQGLLPLLKSIQKPTHLRNFSGQTLGIDAYGWLHRGTVSCAIELAQQKPTRKHIDFALSRVRMLIHFGVKPYLVFDGDYLPSKAHTEKERAARRKESKKLGLELLGTGRVSQAYLELQKAVDVTPNMARELIDELKRLDVPYIVAPYEADSQLAYLEKQGVISGVLSEDSDLLVFGVKCLLTKLDQYGECIMVNRADFTACRDISLVGWTDREFRIMAMLSGCDYLPGINSMGLKTAYRLVRKHKTVERIIQIVQFDGKKKVPAGYLDAFNKAENTFLYQWVYCPEARGLVNLNKLPSHLDAESMPYIGKHVEAEISAGVATGDLDPNTKQRLIVNPVPHGFPGSRRTIVQTPNENKGKPISEFFKPKRTPLAELDPNSFTPSPSQQRLLDNQTTAPWSAAQVESIRPQALNRAAASRTSSAPQPARHANGGQRLDTQSASSKRQRLCSDGALATSMEGAVGIQAATSRFFPKPGAEISPSTRKVSAQRKKKDEFDLWSDDSAAEAVAALTATPKLAAVPETPSSRKRKKMKIYADSNPTEDFSKGDAVNPSAESQETVGTETTAESQNAAPEETPLSSFEVDQKHTQHSVFTKGINASFAALKSKYSFHSTSLKKNPSRTNSVPLLARTPFQEDERKNLLGRLAMSAPSPGPIKQRKDVQSNDVVADNAAEVIPTSSPVLAAQAASIDENAPEDFIDDEEWLEIERHEAHPNGSLVVQGSEDLLVPNSPDSSGDDDQKRPNLDLGRFAFAGRIQ